MAGRGSLFGGRSKAPALSITVQLDVVELVGKAAQNDKVIVEVDMPGVEEDDLTKSTPASEAPASGKAKGAGGVKARLAMFEGK